MRGGEGQVLKGQPVAIRGRKGTIESDEPNIDNSVKVKFEGGAVVWVDIDLLVPAGKPTTHSPIAEVAQ